MLDLIYAVLSWAATDPERAMLYVAAGCYALTHIAAWTPWAWDNAVMSRVRAVLDVLAGNYGFARNAVNQVKAIDDAVSGNTSPNP